jgi:hypothetical protein
MVTDLIARHLKKGAPKKPSYGLLGWPEIVSGNDYDFSRTWIYCLHREEEDAFMSHNRCTRELDIIFAPPNQTRVQRVFVHPATHVRRRIPSKPPSLAQDQTSAAPVFGSDA